MLGRRGVVQSGRGGTRWFGLWPLTWLSSSTPLPHDRPIPKSKDRQGWGSVVGLAVGKMRSGILIPASVPTGSTCARIWQNPRFIARKRGAMVEIRCYTKDLGAVSWLRKRETDLEPKPLLKDARILESQNGTFATLTIQGIQFQDNGIYFCQQKCLKESLSMGCGTELRVMGVFGACPPAKGGEGVTGPWSLH